MLSLKTNSLAFKSIFSFIILTFFIITMLVVVVWENQMDLVGRNTEMNAQIKSMEIRTKIDKLLSKESLTESLIRRISKEIRNLSIEDFSVYKDNGEIVFESKTSQDRRAAAADQASNRERQNIDRCIYRNTFMDKAFYHDMLWEQQGFFRIGHKWSRVRFLDLYIPSGYGTQTIVVRFRLFFNELLEQRTHLFRQTILVGFIIIFLQIIFALAMGQMILRPLSLLNRATGKIAKGNLHSRVNILRNDEIGQLANYFKEMAVALQHMQEADRGANPLTGLPGNITIAQEIDKRLDAREDIAVIYADLDNFKAYNDKYGFTRGDDVILYTRDCFLEAVKTKGGAKTFLGHEGGDDFVALTTFDDYEPLVRAIIANFDRDIVQFYNETDIRNGYIESVNRQGQRMRFPIMTISLAVVSNHYRRFNNHVELVSVVTEMKKVVKKYEGSNFAVDKRTA